MVTGEQVRAAVQKANIQQVEHHDCSICGYMTRYLIKGDQLYFDPGCDCGVRRTPEPRTWASAAEWINMQQRTGKWGDVGAKIAAKFGLELEPAG